MAFSSSTMRLSGGIPGQQLFMYRTADAETSTDDSGYFDNAVTWNNLSTGDVILNVYAFGGSMGLRGYVAAVDGTTKVATVADMA
jgi:hypothetical protein